MDALESRVDNEWDQMTQAAREKARANLKALRQQRNELAEWYVSFKNSSAGAWEQMKKGFSDAYQAMKDSWEKAKSEFDTDNNYRISSKVISVGMIGFVLVRALLNAAAGV
ncbi:MAG: hypothetical protein R6V15_16025 [Desulfotignum sp.]